MNLTECTYHTKGTDPLLNRKHFHENKIELIQILEGGGKVLINNKLFPMVTGAVYCIDSQNLHCTIPNNGENYCRNKITVPKDELKRVLSDLGGENILDELTNQGIFIFDNETASVIEGLFCDIATQYSDTDKFNVSLSLLKIFSILNTDSVKNKISQNTLIEKVMQYINTNLENSIKLTDICQSLYISESYLCHTFKKELNMTVKEYIREQQIIKAIALLENTDEALENISYACGFSSHSQFSKCFKAKLGCSPRVYRLSHKKTDLL